MSLDGQYDRDNIFAKVLRQVEAVVVFQSGFAANAGTVSAVLNKEDVVISDELNHASIIDGCRLSRATIKVFPHRDIDAARRIADGSPRLPPSGWDQPIREVLTGGIERRKGVAR